MLAKLLSLLEGKRTVLVGFLIATLSLLRVFWPEAVPNVTPEVLDGLLGALGVLVMVFRSLAQKPGSLAKPVPGD